MSCMVGSDINRCAKLVNAGLLKAADKSIFPILGKPANGFGAAAAGAAFVSRKQNKLRVVISIGKCVNY